MAVTPTHTKLSGFGHQAAPLLPQGSAHHSKVLRLGNVGLHACNCLTPNPGSHLGRPEGALLVDPSVLGGSHAHTDQAPQPLAQPPLELGLPGSVQGVTVAQRAPAGRGVETLRSFRSKVLQLPSHRAS